MKKLSFYILIICIIGILPSLLQYGTFMIATDFATQEVPFILETKRMLSTGTPFWSWNHYLGDNFIGSYSFYTLTSPFVWINCLFPYKYILTGITFTLILKFLCLGWFSFLFFKKMDVSQDLSIIGALLYTFSSYTISNLFYYHFMEPMICFPIFLIAIEKYLKKENYNEVLLFGASFLTIFINFYFAPCTFIFAGLYVFCKILCKEDQITTKSFVKAIGLIIGGVLMSSVILLPTIFHLSGGERVGIHTDINTEGVLNIIERIRTLFIPKLLEEPNPLFATSAWNSNAANISIIGVLLSALYCLTHNNWLKWLVITSIILYITPLNGGFSLFTNPHYSRWAYALTFILVLSSIKYLDEGRNISKKQLFIYLFIATISLILSYTLGIIYLHKTHTTITTYDINNNYCIFFFFILNTCLLFLYYNKQSHKALQLCIIVFTCLYFPSRVFLKTDAYFKLSDGTGWDGYIKKYVLANLENRNNQDFEYRTDFVTRKGHIYANLGMLTNTASISSSSSVFSNVIKPLLCTADSTKLASGNQFSPNKNIASFDALMSVKHIYIYNDSLQQSANRDNQKKLIKKTNTYSLYDNPHFIPFGFSYDHYITTAQLDSIIKENGTEDIPLQMLANVVIEETQIPCIKDILIPGKANSLLKLDSLVEQRRQNTCSAIKGNTCGFNAEVFSPQKKLFFFSVPADPGFTVKIDGVKTSLIPVNLGLSGIIVEKGFHHIVFDYCPRGLKIGLLISLASLLLLIVLIIKTNKREREKLQNQETNY